MRPLPLGGIGIHQSVVLVGLKRLLAAPFAPEHNPALRYRRRPKLFFRELEELRHHPIVQFRHNSRDVTGARALPHQQRQQVPDPFLCNG